MVHAARSFVEWSACSHLSLAAGTWPTQRHHGAEGGARHAGTTVAWSGFASTFCSCTSGIAWSRLAKCSFEGVGNSFVATFAAFIGVRGKRQESNHHLQSSFRWRYSSLTSSTPCTRACSTLSLCTVFLLAVRGPPWISEHHLMFHMLLGPRDHQTSRLEARNEN